MTTFACPLEGCDYTAEKASSVEAHISSSQGVHKGEVGRQYREQLRPATEAVATEPLGHGTTPGGEPPLDEDAGQEDVEDADQEDVEDADQEDVEDADQEDVKDADADLSGPAAGAAAAGGAGLFAMDSVETDTLLKVGAAVVLLVMLVALWKKSQSGSQAPQQRQQAQVETVEEDGGNEFNAVQYDDA